MAKLGCSLGKSWSTGPAGSGPSPTYLLAYSAKLMIRPTCIRAMIRSCPCETQTGNTMSPTLTCARGQGYMRTVKENEQRATIANSAQPSASRLCPEGDVRVRHHSLPSPQSATVVACNFCFVVARPDQRITDPVAVKHQERGRQLRPPAELGRKSIVCLSPGAVIASLLLKSA
jgi:hypothetical protein